MKLLVGLMGVGLLGAPAVYPPDIQLFGVGAGQTVIVEGDGCSLRVANTAVAEWVGGRVIGKARGATWLTAKCANGLTTVPVTVRKGAPNDSPDTPPMTDLRVYPKERILVGKDASQQLVAVAYYSDGSVRDVTGLVQYSSNNPDVVQVSAKGEAKARQTGETAVIVRTMGKADAARILVAASRADKTYTRVPRNNFIDEHVFAKLEKLNIRPSELTSDAEFLRRVFLDAIGKLPTEEETRAFLQSKEAGKRTRIVDWLVAQPEFKELARADEKDEDARRAFVNRVWKRYLGRGLVEDVNDFRVTNPPTNPALLDALAAEFARNKFSVRRLARTIFLSRTYQLSSTPNETNRGDSISYSRFGIRRLTAETLADAIAQVTAAPIRGEDTADAMFLRTLTRFPTAAERGAVLQDALRSILNSEEFLFNH